MRNRQEGGGWGLPAVNRRECINNQGAKGPAGPIPLLPSHTSYSYNYKVKKNNKATNRHYSGLWPYIITQSGNLTCQTPEVNHFL